MCGLTVELWPSELQNGCFDDKKIDLCFQRITFASAVNRIGLPFQNLPKSLVALVMTVHAYCPSKSSPACLECARMSTKCLPHWYISFLLLRILNLRVRLNGFYIQAQLSVQMVDGRSVRFSVKSLMGLITKFCPRSRTIPVDLERGPTVVRLWSSSLVPPQQPLIIELQASRCL